MVVSDFFDRRIKKDDIRLYMTAKRNRGEATIHSEDQHGSSQDDSKIDKMKIIREKMTQSRKKKENQDIKNAILIKKRNLPKTWKGEKLIYAKDVRNDMIQDEMEVVIVGADVKALYPSLTDLKVA